MTEPRAIRDSLSTALARHTGRVRSTRSLVANVLRALLVTLVAALAEMDVQGYGAAVHRRGR